MLLRKVKFIILFISLCTPGVTQVNLQTGSAVFSLPMFNWQDDKSRLTSVIALNYSSGSGLKVTDVASNVGQGWNLIAGGVITRLQVGEPDDQPPYAGTAQYGNGSDQDLTKYPGGYLYGGAAAAVGCPDKAALYPTYGAVNVFYKQPNAVTQDRQLDYFAFQFNGKSGMFVLDANGGDHGVMLGDSRIKITFTRDNNLISQGIRTTINSFSIQDVDGLIYKFSTLGKTKLMASVFSNADGTKRQMQPKIKDVSIYCQSAFDDGPTAAPWQNQYMANPYIISSWYLSEIDDPFTTRKIIFNYTTLNLTNAAGTDISYNEGSNRYIVISYKKSITVTQEISSIVYPDGHQANFYYSAASRFDYPGQSAMAYVNMTYQGRYLSQYQLNTSYFILNRYGTPTTPYQKRVARLCLRSVKKIGVDLKEDSPPYLFDYYTGSSAVDDFVPPPFSYVKDIWGYYNGNNSVAFDNTQIKLTEPTPYTVQYLGLEGLCFKHTGVTGTYYNAKPNYARNGLLKTITYPTGGSLGYVYGQNRGALMGTSTTMDVGGVHVSQTSSLDGGFSNGCGVPVITQYDYVMNGVGSASSLWGLERPMNTIVSNNDWKEERQTIHFSFSYPFGTCLWHFVDPGILSQYESVSLSQFQQIMNVISPILGVLSVISDIMDVVNVSLGTPLAVIAVILDVITAALSYVLSCPQATKLTSAVIYYDFDLNSSSPMPAQFKRVEITESPGTIGKTVEWFTNADDNDYALWDQPNGNIALTIKQRYAPWAYGLPKLITQYDVNGNKIKETQNVYDTSLAKFPISDPSDGVCGSKLYIPIQSCRCEVFNNKSKRGDWWAGDAVNIVTTSPSMNIDFYNMYTGRIILTNTYERTYRTNDPTQFVQTETDYYYNKNSCNPTNYDVNQIVTTQSNGDVSFKNIKYTIDYNTGILATMVQNNMVSTPVATNTYVIKAGTSTPQYLNEKVTEFVQVANGDIKPSRIIEQRFASPVSTLVQYSGPTTTNYSIYKIPQQFTYDAYGNLVGLKDEGSRVVTNIYDYNDKYITASVINADPALDKSAYSSFESTDLTRSGWSLSGASSSVPNSSAPTGSNVFNLLGLGVNSLTSTPLVAKPYTLSFWANSGNVSVTGGATLIKSAPTYSGFTYYEYNIAQGTSSVLIKNNTASNINIDELRLYPASARMKTTTYDPLIGKTSECDVNNRITYYTYDNLGRMKFIEDEGRNIVKMYEYNNVSAAKQTGCQVTYSNNLLTEIINRSNCSAGNQGSAVPVTIPAGQFSSTVSQFDADIQAEIYLLTNGQSTANASGSCSLIYYNVYKSELDTTQICNPGYVGGPVNYAVAAGTYSSIIGQADADQQALDDIAANAMAYANNPTYASCTISTTPDWEWFAGDERTPPDSTYCLSVNGQLPPHLFLLATDVNPNSPSYNQKQWMDHGPNSLCAANTYFNAQQTVVFTRNNCGAGFAGVSGPYVVPPGKYSSTVSQAAADLQATNEINTLGQNYANNHFGCVAVQNIHYVDSRSFQYSVRLTSTTNGNVYNFTANANTTGTLGQVPSDTYTVYICPVTNYVANNNYTVQGITQTSVICATFNNISITGTANMSFY